MISETVLRILKMISCGGLGAGKCLSPICFLREHIHVIEDAALKGWELLAIFELSEE